MTSYLQNNWISIAALIISFVSLFLAIINWQESKQIRLQEKYNLWKNRNLALFLRETNISEKLNELRDEYEQTLKELIKIQQARKFPNKEAETTVAELIKSVIRLKRETDPYSSFLDNSLKHRMELVETSFSNKAGGTFSDLTQTIGNIESIESLHQEIEKRLVDSQKMAEKVREFIGRTYSQKD